MPKPLQRYLTFRSKTENWVEVDFYQLIRTSIAGDIPVPHPRDIIFNKESTVAFFGGRFVFPIAQKALGSLLKSEVAIYIDPGILFGAVRMETRLVKIVLLMWRNGTFLKVWIWIMSGMKVR